MLKAEAGSLSQSKQGLQADLRSSQEQAQQLQSQVQALQHSMLEQAQHAQQVEARQRSQHESEILSLQGRFSSEVVALRDQQAAAAEETQEALQAQQHQAHQLHSDLLAKYGILERRFNAR